MPRPQSGGGIFSSRLEYTGVGCGKDGTGAFHRCHDGGGRPVIVWRPDTPAHGAGEWVTCTPLRQICLGSGVKAKRHQTPLASCHDCEAVVASFRQGWNIRVLAAEKMTPVRCTDAMP
jgi:hypothetical protein